MKNALVSLALIAVAIALVIAGFHLVKTHSAVNIRDEELSMDLQRFQSGRYALTPLAPGEAAVGDVVAYTLQGEMPRLARVMARAGQTVSVAAKTVTVDQKAMNQRVDNATWKVPPFRVPQGCVFLVSDRSDDGKDSLRCGAIPEVWLLGKIDAM